MLLYPLAVGLRRHSHDNKVTNSGAATKAIKTSNNRMKQTTYPAGWKEVRIQQVLRHYEFQTEDEAIKEDEAEVLRNLSQADGPPHKTYAG